MTTSEIWKSRLTCGSVSTKILRSSAEGEFELEIIHKLLFSKEREVQRSLKYVAIDKCYRPLVSGFGLF